MKKILTGFTLLLLVVSCVPKSQYEALVTERNYYRNINAEADSLAELRSINTYDSQGQTANELEARIRQVEALTATNQALNRSYADLEVRYRELLDQNQGILTASGNEVSTLQQTLAERSAEISRKEAELRQIELDLTAREQQVASLESAYAPAGGGAPASYGRVSATSPLNPVQNTALTINGIQNEVSQIMAAFPQGSYVLAPRGSNGLQIVLRENLLFGGSDYAVSAAGQDLLRRLANTLRNYPAAEFTVVGHADGSQGNALRAYEDSTDKAINVVTQLVNFGLDPGKIVAGGKGMNDPVANNATPEGKQANRRTDLIVIVPQ